MPIVPNDVVVRLKWICKYVAFLGLATVILGCDRSEREDRPPRRQTERDIDRLRSLPYMAGTTAPEKDSTGVVVFDNERTCPGYRLYTVQMLGRAELITETGNVLRRWQQPGDRWERAELLPNGDLLVIGMEDHGWKDGDHIKKSIADSSRYVMRMDWSGKRIWKQKLLAHHDIELTPDGKLLLLTFERRRVPRIHSTIDTRDDLMTLLNDDGELVASRSMLDAIWKDPNSFPLKPVKSSNLGGSPWVDVFHANSIEWMHHENLFLKHPMYKSDNVLVCVRHQDRVAIFDWAERKWIWSWGQNQTSGPHDAQMLENGHILLFDNGLSRGWSRAIELDPLSGEIVWTYQGDPLQSFYSASKGSVQRLPNGNTLLAESDRGRAIEVTPDGDIVWEFICPYGVGRHNIAAIVRIVYHPVPSINAIQHKNHTSDGQFELDARN